MFVALDTNSWFSERLLRSGLGATLLFALRQRDARLILPRVVRLEAVAQLTEDGVKAVATIEKSLRTVASLLGRRPDPELPTADTIRNAIDGRFDELAEFIDQLDPSIEDYSRAIERVIAKRPSNGRDEQFRDSLILEQLLRHFEGAEGFLVTNDGDFFAAKGSRELAPLLKEELAAVGSRLRVVSSIEDVLTGLGQSALQPPRAAILEAISRDVLFTLHAHATQQGYEIGDSTNAAIEAYVTEHYDELFISFEVTWLALRIPLADGSVLPEGTVIATGTAIFNLRSRSASNMQISQVQVRSQAREVIHQNATVYPGAITFGARTVPYRLRRQLDQ